MPKISQNRCYAFGFLFTIIMEKLSRFEFAIMQVADPIEAEKHQAYTENEELEIRSNKLLESAKEIFIDTKNLKLEVKLNQDVKGIGKKGKSGIIYQSNVSTNENICVLFNGHRNFRYVNSRFLEAEA